MPQLRRVLIKLSGRAVAGPQGSGFSPEALDHLAREVLAAREVGTQVAIVVGGGNIFRGSSAEAWGIDRVEADNIGMLATVINAILLRGRLSVVSDYDVRVMTAVPISAVAEPFIRLRAIRHLEKGRIVILAGGIGQPFVTTDYPAVQRAAEIEAEAILMGKQGVQGVYDSDPRINRHAVKYDEVTYQEVLAKNLQVMDATATALCMDNRIPIVVFDMMGPDHIVKVVLGEDVGQTFVRGE